MGEQLELTPILGDEENKSSQERGNHKLRDTVKGIGCAFPWAFLVAVSRICVQALENRSVKPVLSILGHPTRRRFIFFYFLNLFLYFCGIFF